MKTVIVLVLLLVAPFVVQAQDAKSLRNMPNRAFKKGEVLKFRVHYGIIDAGEATLEVKDINKKIGNRDVFHIVGSGKSNGAFDWFFKVRDRYETYLDQEAIVPWLFLRNIQEGSYKLTQNVIFNHYADFAKSNEGKETKTPNNVQDLVSTYYYARCLDYTNAKIGDIYTLQTFLDDEVFTFSYKYLGKETITTSLGTFKCVKFCPTLLKGRVFKKEDDMTVWITDDENKIPVRAQAEILVGSVKMDLMQYENVANPMAIVKK